jgi:hypothetical protein
MSDQTNETTPVPTSPLNSPDPKIRAAWQTQLYRLRQRNRVAQSNPQPGLVPGETLNKRKPL